ncbi:transketolase [Paraburkholderia caffeinilytica]|uniref:transketolase n=1 Tax=Paraburkholderia caffeinilytica TaxID=1761016 RepID=UPI000E219590|nr:transketolase [Paraburkholderia caffeinilytica]AXL48669.1 transketolase [Paraburkholderia caffeinilytica]CAB3798302.1 Transketolase 1 [Paraburkholderia caffeinilytica]
MSTTEAQPAAPIASNTPSTSLFAAATQTPSPQQASRLPLADAIRFLSIDSILRAGEGHQGVPLGMAEIATALFTRHLKFNPADPAWPDRDRFVLSNGHGSLLLYSLLYLTGYEAIGIDQLKTFRELGSHCAGHPEYDPAHGIEATTGPLGQGIANAFGMAIAEAYLAAKFGRALVDHYTYAFVGDGCLQEGIGQEMISLAGHLRLGKLILCWDDNQITDDGSTALSISEDVCARFRVAGWQVIEVDGHDLEAVSAALTIARADPRPSMIACKTVIGRGIVRLQGQRGGHSGKLFQADADAARAQLGWPHAPFHVPSDVLGAWREAGRRSSEEYNAWHARLAALPDAQCAEFERVMAGGLPEGWRDVLDDYRKRAVERDEPQPGITVSGEISDLFAPLLPERMVGCADLEAPTGHKRQLHAFTADDPSGAYVHCGVREHLMGAMANGMAAHGGIVATSVTYLAFSDYQRPAMRMAALMGLPVHYVFSHDSIGVGKNGPTHQPVEILASLRAMPNMRVLRPADAVEAAECWALALEHRRGPSTLVFARQALPLVRREHSAEPLSRRGAYVLAEAEGGARVVTLLATGSEVALALQARRRLQDEGIATAVVSMPCWEIFDEQSADYRAMVLGPNTVRVGIEAALRFGWDRYLGERGGFVGMTGFGASASAETLYEHFGITAEHVVAEAKRHL